MSAGTRREEEGKQNSRGRRLRVEMKRHDLVEKSALERVGGPIELED